MQHARRRRHNLLVLVGHGVRERIEQRRQAADRLDGDGRSEVVGGGVEEARRGGALQNRVPARDEDDQRVEATRRLAQLLRRLGLARNVGERPHAAALRLAVGRPLLRRLEEAQQRRESLVRSQALDGALHCRKEEVRRGGGGHSTRRQEDKGQG